MLSWLGRIGFVLDIFQWLWDLYQNYERTQQIEAQVAASHEALNEKAKANAQATRADLGKLSGSDLDKRLSPYFRD